MPVFTVRPQAHAYGYCVGILLLDVQMPFVPGDVGNAASYGFPVLYRTVPGALSARVFVGDEALTEAVVNAAVELEAQGVKGISSDCGFFLNYQEQIREAVNIPVFLSPLMQLPTISSFLGRHRSLGILTTNTEPMSNSILALTGLDPEREVIIRGMQDCVPWRAAFKEPGEQVDTAEIEAEIVARAVDMQRASPHLGAILLECSMMPPYAHAVHQATGLPVFDFVTLINYYQRAAYKSTYRGYY